MDARSAKRLALDLVVAHVRRNRDHIIKGEVATESEADVARLDQAVEDICDELERRGKS